MSKTGEKPGKGTYKCDNCGQQVTLDDEEDALPPCPRCHGTEFHPQARGLRICSHKAEKPSSSVYGKLF